MKTYLAIALLIASTANAQTAQDSADIRATAMDYVDGWYTGDAARMERALHPELAKRIVNSNPVGRSALGQMSAMSLVQGVRNGGGKDIPAEQQQRDVKILDIFENAASVRATMSGWVDYMHIGRYNGRWVIVNVLWEFKPDARAELARAYNWQDAAFARNDVRALMATYAPTFRATTRDGRTLDRAAVETSLKMDTERTKSVERATSHIDDLSVTGNEALVTVTRISDRTVADEKGVPHRWESGIVNKERWARTRDGWRILELAEVKQLYLRKDGK